MSLAMAMVNGHDPGSDSLGANDVGRLQHYFQVDSERQRFIQTMLHKIDTYVKRISDLELDLQDQRKSRSQYQADCAEIKIQYSSLIQKFNRDPFVVVLIDGDGAKFADDLLRDPVGGAARAALNLRQAVRDSLRAIGPGCDDVPILARVYCNLNDLSKSLRLSDVIDHDDDMRLFAEKFTNTRADFDFVNVGKGKENADSKIRRMLSHYYRNVQCKKIFLAGCTHDNGYLHDLRDFSGAEDNKVLLVETTPAEPSFKNLGFPIIRFEGVFRSEPLNNETKRVMSTVPNTHRSASQPGPGPIARPLLTTTRPPPGFPPFPLDSRKPEPPSYPFPTSPVTAPAITDSSHDQFERKSESLIEAKELASAPDLAAAPVSPKGTPKQPTHASRTSSVVNSSNGGTSISYATAGGAQDHQNITVKIAKPKKQPKVIFYNVDQCRLDSPTQHPPRTPAQASYNAKFLDIKPSVFCNDFYLKGRCKWGANCDKTHDVELTGPEVAIHRYKARTSVCPSGPYCVDYDCYLSHHCPRNPCTRLDSCAFAYTERWGDLHLTKDQLQPATKWTEGVDMPEHLR